MYTDIRENPYQKLNSGLVPKRVREDRMINFIKHKVKSKGLRPVMSLADSAEQICLEIFVLGGMNILTFVMISVCLKWSSV